MSSQITINDADTLLTGLVLSTERAAWDALSDPDKQVLLNRAQAMVDAGNWEGVKYDDDQTYAFPREDDDGELIGESADPDPLAPLAVREALALLAWSLIERDDVWERRRSIASGLASQAVSGISEAYTGDGGASKLRGDLQAIPEVWTRLATYWRVGGRIV